MPEYGPSEAELFNSSYSSESPDATEHTSDAELLRKMEASDGAQFILHCLQTDVFAVPEGEENNRPIRINPLQLHASMTQFKDRVDSFWQNIEDLGESFGELQAERDSDADAKVAMREAIKTFYSAKIIDREWLVEASKLAGPGNTGSRTNQEFIQSGNNNPPRGQYNYSKYYDDLEASGWHRQDGNPPPMPGSKMDRDEHIRVYINPDGLLLKAASMARADRESGDKLSQNQVVQLEDFATAAHEYGHALDMAYRIHGSDTFEIGKKQGSIPLADILPARNQQVTHQEMFARGMEQTAVLQYLQDKFNYTPEEATAFKAALYERDHAKADAYLALFEYAPRAGLTPLELLVQMYYLQKAIVLLGDDRYRVMVPDIKTITDILYRPYSLDQIKAMQPELPEDLNSVRRLVTDN